MKEIESHTALRGLASIGVVLFHYTIGLNYHHYLEKSHAFVDMFFILSGFIIAAVYSGYLVPGAKFRYRSFYFSRFARIYPLYIAALTLTVGFFVVVGKEMHDEAASHIAFSLFAVQAWGVSDQFYFNFPAWSISAEFAAYLCFPIFALYWRNRSSIPLLLAVVVLSYIILIHNYGTLNIDERLAGLRGVVGFALGMIVYHYRGMTEKLQNINLMQIGAILSLFSCFYFEVSEIFLIPSFAALIALTWTDSGFLARFLSIRIFQLLGAWSFGIYLLHIPITMVGSYLWPHVPFVNLQNKELFITVMLASTIMAAFLSYQYFEKPMRKWIKSLATDNHSSRLKRD
ncbi:acyltransferase family protein [Methylophaga sp.]|uniref:acyltransferase family protein n=1 Tax=Methylophaga sp. TaxID=2024840 RepID=UPI003A901CA4